MKTTVSNRQTDAALRIRAVRELCVHLACALEEDDPSTSWCHVDVILTGDEFISRTHRDFLGADRSTDVISFRFDPVPGEPGCSGDVLVNVACALREGPRHEGADAELALYLAHGFNHLSGACDDTPARRAAMRRRERRWLAAFGPGRPRLFTSTPSRS